MKECRSKSTGACEDENMASRGEHIIRVRVQIIRHFKTCTTDIYLQNECAHVGLSVHAPVSVCLHTAALAGALFRNQPVVLDHVQNAQIHAVRANFHIIFSVGIYSDGFPIPSEMSHTTF